MNQSESAHSSQRELRVIRVWFAAAAAAVSVRSSNCNPDTTAAASSRHLQRGNRTRHCSVTVEPSHYPHFTLCRGPMPADSHLAVSSKVVKGGIKPISSIVTLTTAHRPLLQRHCQCASWVRDDKFATLVHCQPAHRPLLGLSSVNPVCMLLLSSAARHQQLRLSACLTAVPAISV